MPYTTFKILEIPIFPGDIKQAADIILEDLNKGKKNKCISLTGAHGIVYANQDKNFKDTLNSFYMNLPDGMPSVWIGKLKGNGKMKRCYGPDFFAEMMKATNGKEINHFFCGGKEGIAEELKKVCEKKFGNDHISGTYSPPFREMTEKEFIELGNEISSNKTNILWIGISTPKQELLADKLSKYTNVNFIITVGAAFDFHTNRIKQAPRIIQNLGLEWFFRLIIEPKRLWKRYVMIVPLFIFFNFKELITGKFFK